MTISEFLETNEGKHAILKTNFADCEIEESVESCLRRMQEENNEWMGVIDDAYLTSGVRRQDLIDAIEQKKPDDRWEIEKSSVGTYSFLIQFVAHPEDDAQEIARKLATSNQHDLFVADDQQNPLAVLPAATLTEHPQFREKAHVP